MTDTVQQRRGVPVLVCSAEGPPIVTTQDALDVIGAAYGVADVVAIPARRLGDAFFQLRTGVAGEVMQKFVNYSIRLAVVGDIAERVEASTALRDLVRESNRGRHIWFVTDLDQLDTHL
jgi:Domain of unknown function (DUF4180)